MNTPVWPMVTCTLGDSGQQLEERLSQFSIPALVFIHTDAHTHRCMHTICMYNAKTSDLNADLNKVFLMHADKQCTHRYVHCDLS